METREELTIQGALLRRMCVDTHNGLVRESGGYSEVGQLIRVLKIDTTGFRDRGPKHLMFSSYAFWGSREWGGSRRSFERRLKRNTTSELWKLHEAVRDGVFGAWKCVFAEDDGRSRWVAIGPARGEGGEVMVVTSGPCDVVDPKPGQVRAGWFVELASKAALMYSLELAPEAVGKLAEAADTRAWHDDKAPPGSKSRVVEYERDVLIQALEPGGRDCGLEPYYYLPTTVRKRFPARFRRSMFRTMADGISSQSVPWHVQLARADREWIDEFVVGKLSQWRQRARRRAQNHWEHPVSTESLARVLDDGQCLQMLGLTKEAGIDLGEFPPLKLHPVTMLELDWEWLEERRVKSDDVIHGARKQMRNEEDRRRFEEEVEHHQVRLRWCALVRTAKRNVTFRTPHLNGGYEASILAAHQLFDPILTELPLSELLAHHSRVASRIEAALEKAGYGDPPFTVGALPEMRYELELVRGIGRKSLKVIEEVLYETLTRWPDRFFERSSQQVDEAREEIEAGLDALEELF